MTTLTARPEAITFDPQQSALIVVDMQNAYATPGGYLDLAGFDVSTTRPVIANIQTAVTAARAAGMLIIWFQNGWDEQYVEAGGPGSPNFHKSNALKTMRKQPQLQGKLLAKGSWDYQLVDELVPQPGDIVLPKPRYSGFFNTPLAWVEAQPLFLYPADWMAARAPRLEAEDALALAHFQGKNNLLRRLNALKRADFSHHADRIRCPVQIICASDDLLVPSACSSELHAALPDSQKMVMPYGGHACNVTDPETFNALLLNGLASLLHHREAAL
ncbi:isochorismatase family protein [Escherichia coli]